MKFKFLFAVAALGLLATGCSNEENPNAPDGNGVKKAIQLTITTTGEEATRAASQDGEIPVTGESEIVINEGLKVFVFNENGTFDTSEELRLVSTGTANVYETPLEDAFEVTSGNKFFFVFANANGYPAITKATANTSSMEVFMKSVIEVASADASQIATNGSFLLGTLWAEKIVAAGGGTDEEPYNVPLQIGRLASKINLAAVAYTDGSEAVALNGTFSAATYRLGSLAKRINVAGVHTGFATGSQLPFGAAGKGVLVTSAVHEEAPLDEDVYNTTAYNQYSSPTSTYAGKAINAASYATENTSAYIGGVQYFGNTTYMQIETTYTPGAGDLSNPTTLEQIVTAGVNGADFWTATVKVNDATLLAGTAGKRLMFNADPSANTNLENIHKYTQGKNYHKFPIQDQQEENALMKNRVLRNHSYSFNITGFNDLGSWTSDVDPTEPIPDNSFVEFTVTVRSWDKVVGDIEL
jgi:hypothetical protein